MSFENGNLAALTGLLTLAIAAVLAPVPEIGFVLQVAALFAALFTIAGLLLERRDPTRDWSKLAAVGGSFGFALGVLLVFLRAIGVI